MTQNLNGVHKPQDEIPGELAETVLDVGLASFDDRWGPIFVPPQPARKIAAVMARIQNLAKDGTNQHFNFDYLSADQLLNYLRPILAEVGLVILPHLVGKVQTPTMTQLTWAMVIIDTETGTGYVARWESEASDKTDKGINKAVTIGRKTFYMSLFNIQGMDDPDAQAGVEEGKATGKKSASGGKGQTTTRTQTTSTPKAQTTTTPKTPQPPAGSGAEEKWVMTKELAAEVQAQAQGVYGDKWPAEIQVLLANVQAKKWSDLTRAKYDQILKDLAKAREALEMGDQAGTAAAAGDDIPFGNV